MECSVRTINNAVMIDSLDKIIQQESWKLEMDKNSGLLSKKSKLPEQPLKENENMATKNIPYFKSLKIYSPKLSHSHDRDVEIERLANVFTQSPCYFTTNGNDVKNKQGLLNKKLTVQNHNELNNCKILASNKNKTILVPPDIKVRRNVRFGEYSPLNPANQENSHLGIGEYDDKRKKLLEMQKKEYIDYLSKIKQEKNVSDLPKLAFSCEESFKTAMESNNNSDDIDCENMHYPNGIIQLAPFVNTIESCALDEAKIKETNRLKQELYRFELSKQIEEKKKLELERKIKDQIEDEAIERAAREQEEKVKNEFKKEIEKRTLVQLQKEFQQEKLKSKIMQKQINLETKPSCNPTGKIVQHETNLVPNNFELFKDVTKTLSCQSTFDNLPLPTTRTRVPRKIVYDDESESANRIKNISYNTDTLENSSMNKNISLPVMKKANVTYTKESPIKRNEYNPTALLPVTKTMIIDSPLVLALTGLNNSDDKKVSGVTITEPTEKTYKNQITKEVLLGNNHKQLTDKHLLSNLGYIRKQLDIEHYKLKQQVKKSQ